MDTSILITRLKTILVVMIITVHATSAQSIGLLRDPDIEHGLQELADPILLSAGIKSNNIKVLIVNDLSLNAFVIDNHHIFIHAGLVLKLTSAEQLQSVIAHEAAHIANGHIARRVANIKRAKVSSAFGVLLAVAAVAGGESKVGAGIALGTASSAQRVFLAHTRVEEASADQAALRYLSHAKVNPGSMSEVFKIFKGQMNLSLERQDPYTRSHPLNRDRIRAINAYTSAATILNKNQTHSYWFKRIQAKLSGFLRTPKWTLTHAKGDDEINLMRQAIANHRIGKGSLAKRKIDQLISLHPKDPYYKELQGQILLENNEYTAAIKAYAKAAQLAPVNAQILGSYGRSLLAVNTRSNNLTALKNLRKARELDNRDARILRDIAIAFARAGNEGQAVLAIAERYALLGDLKNATLQAAKAEGLLSRGSIAWQRAQDILDTVTGP
jgi:predicted Zn-dependent protease